MGKRENTALQWIDVTVQTQQSDMHASILLFICPSMGHHRTIMLSVSALEHSRTTVIAAENIKDTLRSGKRTAREIMRVGRSASVHDSQPSINFYSNNVQD